MVLFFSQNLARNIMYLKLGKKQLRVLGLYQASQGQCREATFSLFKDYLKR